MSIQIFDTMSGSKRVLETVEPGVVRMYVCGLTVYDYAHIGHARTFIVFDVIRRYLARRGYRVRFVCNHTDVDDKIIKRASEIDEDPLALSARFIEELDRDMAALNVLEPDVAPKVSCEIPTIIDMIRRLIDRGHAYVVDANIFFEVSTFSAYGKLSKKVLEELRAGERVEVDASKRSPADFALWKAAKPGEPSWPSPWGEGRPGWHIECSAMSTRYLGETFDIHGGGRDLVFPHHENEIAQSECATGQPFVKYWIHAGPLTIEGEKMSKSLGNVWRVRDILDIYHPDVVRFFMATGHYRKPVNYSEEALEEARSRVIYFYKTLHRIDRFADLTENVPDEGPIRHQDLLDRYWPDVHAAMDDDFNTPRFLALLTELARTANELLPAKVKPIKDAGLLRSLLRLRTEMRRSGEILGILQDSPAKALRTIRDLRVRQHGLDQQHIRKLVDERAKARTTKDWARADQIRDELQALGITLMDTASGTDWEPN